MQVVLTSFSEGYSHISPVTTSFIDLPVTINGIDIFALSVCDVKYGKINQRAWQELVIHTNIHRSESITNTGNLGTISLCCPDLFSCIIQR